MHGKTLHSSLRQTSRSGQPATPANHAQHLAQRGRLETAEDDLQLRWSCAMQAGCSVEVLALMPVSNQPTHAAWVARLIFIKAQFLLQWLANLRDEEQHPERAYGLHACACVRACEYVWHRCVSRLERLWPPTGKAGVLRYIRSAAQQHGMLAVLA